MDSEAKRSRIPFASWVPRLQAESEFRIGGADGRVRHAAPRRPRTRWQAMTKIGAHHSTIGNDRGAPRPEHGFLRRCDAWSWRFRNGGFRNESTDQGAKKAPMTLQEFQ